MTNRTDFEAEASALDDEEHLVEPGRALRLTPRPDDGQPKSTLAVRIAGADIDRLRCAAERTGEATTQMARRFILEGLARAEPTKASPELVAVVAKVLERSTGEIAGIVAGGLADRLADTA